MDAGKPQAGGAGRIAVGIPFGQVASEARNPVVGATRQRQAAEPVLRDVWSKPAENPLVPAALVLGETMRRRRAAAVAWATTFATVAAFTAVLLGWLTLPEDAFVPEEMGGPVGWQSIRQGEAGGYSPALAAAESGARIEECWSRASTCSHRTVGNGRSDRPDSGSRIRARRAEEPEAGAAERAAGDLRRTNRRARGGGARHQVGRRARKERRNSILRR